MALIIIRLARRLATTWLARHEKDGIDEWKLSSFVRSQHALGSFEKPEADISRISHEVPEEGRNRHGGNLMGAGAKT